VSVSFAWAATLASQELGVRSKPSTDLGSDLSVAARLADGREFTTPVSTFLLHGDTLFKANWTRQEGGGRRHTKGTGRLIVQLTGVLKDQFAFNRISAPDANSCASCHNVPHGIVGGGGDCAKSVFVLGQRFDAVTFDETDTLPTRGAVDEVGEPATLQTIGNLRASTGMFGAGYLEMLARQIPEELQHTRDSIRLGETKELTAKGIYFGGLTRTPAGLWDTSKVQGLGRLSLLGTNRTHPPSLAIRPWHQAGNVVSLREFSNTAFNHLHGIQPTERFGLDTDPDSDGLANELTRADVTAVTVWQATLQVPGRVIPRDPEIEQAVLRGEQAFERIGCASCHIPKLPLDKQGWVFVETNPFSPPGNLRTGEIADLKVDLSSDELPAPRLKPNLSGTVWVDAFTDLKLHDICGTPEEREPLDQNAAPSLNRIKDGNCWFLTKRLGAAANAAPVVHDGLFSTVQHLVLAQEMASMRHRGCDAPSGDDTRLEKAPRSAGGQLACVSDIAPGNRSQLRRLHGDDRGRLAIERRELHFERATTFVRMDDGTNVTALQPFFRNGGGQNDAVELLDRHDSLLARVGRHQTGRVLPALDDPDGTNRPACQAVSTPRKHTVDNVLRAERRLYPFGDVTHLRKVPQRVDQAVDVVGRIAHRCEELRLPAVVRVRPVQKIVDDFPAVDDCTMGVRKLHVLNPTILAWRGAE
jgi:Di-haem oxidoreductase, putative peroxidase